MTPIVNAGLRGLLKRVLLAAVLSIAALAVVVYTVDYGVFRYRVAANRQPFGQVTVTSYDAVAQKSGKVQFIFNPPQAVTCVNSIFPRAGYVACWYLRGHAEQRTNI